MTVQFTCNNFSNTPISARYNQIDQKQMKQELEQRSTLESMTWSDRSSRSTTSTPQDKATEWWLIN